MSAHLRSGPAVTFAGKVTLDPTEVPANAVQEESFTVKRLRTDQAILVNKPTEEAGLALIGYRVSAANTLALKFQNFTGTPIDPASQDFFVIQF